MAVDFSQGVTTGVMANVEALNDILVAIRAWFPNRTPLAARLPNVPTGANSFDIYTHNNRAGQTTLAATMATSAAGTTSTGVSLANASFLMRHDVLEVIDTTTGVSEYVHVAADPTITNATTGAGTVDLIRGSGTAVIAGTAASGSVVNLIGNSRTGDEIDQTGLSTMGVKLTQYLQTFQFPVQVGGSAQSTTAAVMPNGVASPFDFNKTMALRNLMDSIETTFYYGKGVAATATATPKMLGLKSILTTNYTATPTNAAAYKASDLVRDAIQKPRAAGGDPDWLLVSTDWMTAFSTWGHAVQRLEAGSTVFGTPIVTFQAPFIGGINVIEAQLLRAGTAISLTSSEIAVRYKRDPFWIERGRRGDRFEGDWVAEVAISVTSEPHHAFIEGVTGFSAN